MTEKSNASKTLGLELTSLGLKAAALSLKSGRPQIDQLFQFYFDPSQKHINPFYLKEADRALLDLSGKSLIVAAIDGNEILVRSLDVKLKKDKDIDAVLQFQAEPLLPYPAENAVLDKITVSHGDEGTNLTLLAVKKEHLKRHLDHWHSMEIEPEVLASIPSVLVAFSNFVLPKDAPAHFILHLGEEQTCCVFAKDGKLIASKASHFSLSTLKNAYQKETGIEDDAVLEKGFDALDWTALENANLPLTYQALKDLAAELNKVVFALMKQTRELSVPPLLVTGEGSGREGLTTFLLKDFYGNLLPLESVALEKYSAAELKNHAITIGEALTALPKYNDQVNFLQGEFTYPHPWKRLQKPFLTFLGLSLGLAVAFYFFGQAYISNRENDLRSKYAELLTVMRKPYDGFEHEIAAKFPSDNESSTEIPPLESLSQEDISFRAGLLQRELQSVPDLYPLSPNIPKVSDFLAWLSTHPNIRDKNDSRPLIEINGINYSLFKRPELTKKQEKYQVKVELDFTSANATAAREFHDALLAPNNFIDPKGEVKWTNNKGKYRATFFLKDKTVYP
jgi:type IV pilus assembly protein PilM